MNELPAKTEAGIETVGVSSSGKTLVEAAYAALRRDILDGTLAPGMKLRAEALKQRYAVSGSTLRESLTRLIGEALVTVEGQRGFRVAPMSLDDIADLTQVRKLIETAALREAIAHGGDVWEAGVVAAFHRLSRVEERLAVEPPEKVSEEWEARNRDFHQALLAGCPSRWLHHFHGVLYQQTERYRRIALATRSVPRDVHAEHAAIRDAVLARDAERACQVLGEHIDRTLEVVRQRLATQSVHHDARRAGAPPSRR
jgi:DNA-binding GntR family transcriptional regulator